RYTKLHLLKCHPDHNDGSERSTIATQLVLNAIQRIETSIKRNNGKYNANGISNEDIDLDVALEDDWAAEIQAEFENFMNRAQSAVEKIMPDLNTEIDNLDTEKEGLTFGEIADLFIAHCRFALMPSALVSLQQAILDKLTGKAKTAEDFFAVAQMHI